VHRAENIDWALGLGCPFVSLLIDFTVLLLGG
jgi:hypothetical protein